MNEDVRIVGISSSPRRGSTEVMLQEALKAAEDAYPKITTEMYTFKGKYIRYCYDCKFCERRETEAVFTQCVLDDDWLSFIRPLVNPVPNGIILAAPVYFSDVNAEMRAFMERFTSLMKPYWFPEIPFSPPDFSRTAGGGLTVGFHRNGGQETAILSMLRFFIITGMVAVGSYCPEQGPIGYYGGTGWEDASGSAYRKGVKEDRWGLYSARVLGRKVAYTALMLADAPQIPKVGEPLVSHLPITNDNPGTIEQQMVSKGY
jgi:multimeric flavodoxin WrbA